MYVLAYTRQPLDEQIYDYKLAYSMHLAYSTDKIHFQALNHNSGVLFAKAVENVEDGTLKAKVYVIPIYFI